MPCFAEKAVRAAFIPNQKFNVGETLSLIGDVHHHLSNVIRLRQGESFLLLNGLGLTVEVRATSIDKRETQVLIEKCWMAPPPRAQDVLIVIPKKDALDSMFKICVEMGVRRIYLLKGQNSPEKLPEERRVHALVQSALEQSNNPWFPQVIHCADWSNFPALEYAEIVVMDLASEKSKEVRNAGQTSVLIVGPEGGFSPSERQVMSAWNATRVVSLPTPILRAPTALAAGLGWMHGRA